MTRGSLEVVNALALRLSPVRKMAAMSPELPLTTTIPLATAARRYRAIADTQRLTPVELLSRRSELSLRPREGRLLPALLNNTQ